MKTVELFKKIDENVELQKKFEGINTPEEFFTIAKEIGLTDDFETMKAAAAAELKKNGSIDENDLSALNEVSGGTTVGEVTTYISVSTISSGFITSVVAIGTGSSAAAV